eukprot:c26543_g3_i1 orf=1-855(-)
MFVMHLVLSSIMAETSSNGYHYSSAVQQLELIDSGVLANATLIESSDNTSRKPPSANFLKGNSSILQSMDRSNSSVMSGFLRQMRKCCWPFLKRYRQVLLGSKISFLLPAVAFSLIAEFLEWGKVFIFLFSLLGIAPLAERLGFVTEQLSLYTGCTVGGLLNATFGNATEMIISIFALQNGMIRVVQLSLLGSILSNMLLVLGCAFFFGGLVHHQKDQNFNQAAAVVNSGLLLMAVMGLLFPAVLHFTGTELHAGTSELFLSRFSSCIMLVAYGSYLYFQLKSHR